MATEAAMPPTYPVTLEVDYPDRNLDRLSSFFRFLWIIPIAIILAAVSGGSFGGEDDNWQLVFGGAGILFFATLLMILFRQKYPKWWFDWNYQLTRFSLRVGVYGLLLRDEYPSTDEEQAVHVTMNYPDATSLNRFYPLIKWFLAIPHFIVLGFLAIAVVVVWIIAWFAILFTGRYPRGLFNFMVGFERWALRVVAYAFLLVTDKYPPFSLS